MIIVCYRYGLMLIKTHVNVLSAGLLYSIIAGYNIYHVYTDVQITKINITIQTFSILYRYIAHAWTTAVNTETLKFYLKFSIMKYMQTTSTLKPR